MKVIITRESDNDFPNCGMNNRMLFKGKSMRHLVQVAKNFAKGKKIRLEIFSDFNFYNSDPIKTIFL